MSSSSTTRNSRYGFRLKIKFVKDVAIVNQPKSNHVAVTQGVNQLDVILPATTQDGLSPRSRQRPRPHAFTDEEDIGFGMDALQDVTLRTQLSPRPASSRPSSAKRLRDVMFSEDSAKELPLDLLPGRRERRTRHIAAQSHDAAHQRVRGARAFTYHVS